MFGWARLHIHIHQFYEGSNREDTESSLPEVVSRLLGAIFPVRQSSEAFEASKSRKSHHRERNVSVAYGG